MSFQYITRTHHNIYYVNQYSETGACIEAEPLPSHMSILVTSDTVALYKTISVRIEASAINEYVMPRSFPYAATDIGIIAVMSDEIRRRFLN
jgi:hypothetical protein